MGEPSVSSTVTQNHCANAVCHHLATMCRMYNDYGFVRQDAAEQNLNSVNLPELDLNEVSSDGKKKSLSHLAQLERTNIEESFK
jgi:hypothetical protein